jgi:hypothetical protein
MTKKTQKTDKKTPAEKETASEKMILFEAVQKHPTQNYIIMGALSKAGLLNQYRQEELDYGIEDIEASITMDELDKHVKNFLGE